MKWNKVVFKFVSISFSILVALLVVVGLIELGSYCYDFGYRVFTEKVAVIIFCPASANIFIKGRMASKCS